MVAIVIVLAALRPWTVVPLDAPHPRAFDAKTYVDGLWPVRVIDEAARSAIALASLFDRSAAAGSGASGHRAVFVTGTARVTKVDLQSRVGLADLAVAGATGGVRVSLQLGPVIRGTALRDALTFIHFSDFENQMQFADVSNALNDRALSTVLGGMDAGALEGRLVTILGAVSIGAETDPREITPVRITIEPGTDHDRRS
jgi:predicted lipoprotein